MASLKPDSTVNGYLKTVLFIVMCLGGSVIATLLSIVPNVLNYSSWLLLLVMVIGVFNAEKYFKFSIQPVYFLQLVLA